MMIGAVLSDKDLNIEATFNTEKTCEILWTSCHETGPHWSVTSFNATGMCTENTPQDLDMIL
jgi:hypothetical protein